MIEEKRKSVLLRFSVGRYHSTAVASRYFFHGTSTVEVTVCCHGTAISCTNTAVPSYGTCQQIRTAVQKPRSFQPLQRRYIPAKNQFIDRVRSLSYRVNKLEVFKLNADDLSLLCCLLWLLTAEARLMLWRCAITQVLMCHLAPFSHNILASQTDTNIT